jgi:hypothetical protein
MSQGWPGTPLFKDYGSHGQGELRAMVPNQMLFGTCCKDMGNALTLPEQRFLFTDEGTSVLFLTIGRVKTDQGTGWLDQAVLFCPFCGTQLQTRRN